MDMDVRAGTRTPKNAHIHTPWGVIEVKDVDRVDISAGVANIYGRGETPIAFVDVSRYPVTLGDRAPVTRARTRMRRLRVPEASIG
jgi:hypothetical protein